jgi:hypothetical protein
MVETRINALRMAAALLTAIGVVNLAAGAFAAELQVSPAKLAFDDAFARRQLVVMSGAHDVTRDATYESSNPDVVAVDATGYVVPLSAGSASITIVTGNAKAAVPVTISAADRNRSIDFATEIVPLLSRFGCNAGGCHGKASGQNGFKLSLFGFDAPFDYQAIVQEGRGRRVFASAPERSLFLQKATGRLPHGGGKRIEPGSEPYQLILRWIQGGVPASSPDVAHVVRLQIFPAERVLQPGEKQQISVVAEYSDGSTRDVTREAQYSSNIDVVATVDSDALVTVGENSGEAPGGNCHIRTCQLHRRIECREVEETGPAPFSALR